MKVKVSDNGRVYSGTWDVTQQDNVFGAKFHLEIERGEANRKLRFESEEEMKRFENRVSLCRMKDEKGAEVYVTGFGN